MTRAEFLTARGWLRLPIARSDETEPQPVEGWVDPTRQQYTLDGEIECHPAEDACVIQQARDAFEERHAFDLYFAALVAREPHGEETDTIAQSRDKVIRMLYMRRRMHEIVTTIGPDEKEAGEENA